MLLFAVTACASGSDDSADASPEPTADAADTTKAPTPTTGAAAPTSTATDATSAPVVVPEALRFTAPLVGGGTFDGAAAAGKPTVFWFWAPT